MIPCNNHVIIDFETGSEDKQDSVVFAASIMFFKWETFCHGSGYGFNDLKKLAHFTKFQVKPQMARGYKFSDSTVKFWKEQVDEKTRHLITLPSAEDIHIRDWFIQTEEWLRNLPKIDRVWSRGNNMEFPILERLLKDHRSTPAEFEFFEKALGWSKIRDTRTWMEAKLGMDFPNNFCPVEDHDAWKAAFATHHPTDDIAADVMRMQAIERAASGLARGKI